MNGFHETSHRHSLAVFDEHHLQSARDPIPAEHNMDSLRQRLKELAPDTFQQLCFHILKEKYPEGKLTHVDGKGGDEGLDIFEGELLGRPTVWQCKSFPNGVGKAQRKQIKESLKTTLRKFSPRNWILCLSTDMDPKALRWFERLKRSYASQLRIGQFPASEIVHELIHMRSVRHHFFGAAALDPVELKRIISRTGELSMAELETVTENNLEDFVERLKERDSRCNYQIVFDGDLGPRPLPEKPIASLLASLSTGQKTINVFARDSEALRSDPPSFSLSFRASGIEKYRSLLRTGASQEFSADDLTKFSTNWALLSPFVHLGSNSKLIVNPSPVLTSRTTHVRLEFRQPGAPTIEYKLMVLRPLRAGTEEAEFICSGRRLPFKLSFVMPIPPHSRATQITCHYDAIGVDVREVNKCLAAMNLLRPSGEIHVFDLETDKMLFALGVELGKETPAHTRLRMMIDDLVHISERFGADLALPQQMSNEDFETMFLLKSYIEAGTLDLGDISATLTKSEQNRDVVPNELSDEPCALRFKLSKHDPAPRLFGTAIDTGPVEVEATVQVNNLPQTLQRFRDAQIGEGVKISFRPVCPARVSLISASAVNVA